jgi:hypothetical protein
MNTWLGLPLMLLIAFCASPFAATLDSEPIKGRVLDADNGKPIRDAVVVAEWTMEMANLTQTCADAAWTATDANGEYSIPRGGLASEKHPLVTDSSMTIAAPGYVGDLFALDGTPSSWKKFGELADNDSRRVIAPSTVQRLIPVTAGKKVFPFNLGPYSCPLKNNNSLGKHLYDLTYQRLCSEKSHVVATDFDLQQLWFYSRRAGSTPEIQAWETHNKRNWPEADRLDEALAETIGGWPAKESGNWVTPKAIPPQRVRQFCKILAMPKKK